MPGGWVEDATVTIAKSGVSGDTTTNSDGQWGFTCTGNCLGVHDVTVEKSGFLTSKTQINVASESTAGQRNIVADSDPFDLNFFDHVYRDNASRGTRKWESTPTVEIWTTEFSCITSSEENYCDTIESLGVSTAASHEANAREAVELLFPGLTGDKLSVPSIQTETHATGTTIDISSCMGGGTVRFVYVDMGVDAPVSNRSYAQNCYFSSSGAYSSSLVVIKPEKTLGTFIHETAHVVGMRHPDGYDAVPRPSVMENSSGNVSRWDEMAGYINYRRPLGTTSPDTDPPGNYINLFRGGAFTALSPLPRGVGVGMTGLVGIPPGELDRLKGIGAIVFPRRPWVEDDPQTYPPTRGGAQILDGRVP